MTKQSWIPWTNAALVAVVCVVGWRAWELERRVADLTAREPDENVREAARERSLRSIQKRLDDSIAEVNELARSAARNDDVAQRIDGLAQSLRTTACDVEDQRRAIARFEALEDEVSPPAIEARLADLGSKFTDRLRAMAAAAGHALEVAETARQGVDHVNHDLARDEDGMWHDMLGPTVQVMGAETVGSGVLLASEEVPGTDDYTTYVLTAWHVVRDLQPGDGETRVLAPVTVYQQDGHVTAQQGLIVEHDATVDVALLRLESKQRFDGGARLASRDRLAHVRVFDRIYAVGCPLGNDPIPTFGEIADVRHVVDGQSYWMISAPTYIGNSGGGVFDAETHELLGLFTKIYTHGTVRPMVVPHMGLATPMPAVYDWLEHVGYAQLEPRDKTVHAQTAAANR